MPQTIQEKNKLILDKLMNTETTEVTRNITTKKMLLGALQIIVINITFQAWAFMTKFITEDFGRYAITSFIIFVLTVALAMMLIKQAKMISKTVTVLYDVAEREASIKDFSRFTEEATNINSTTKIVKLLAKSMGISDESAIEIAESVKFLDIGKVAIDEDLKKKTELTPEEFNKIKDHVEIGYKISKMMGHPQIINNVIRFHRERWDGSGYVNGLSKEDIPMEARIVAICDVYDALTHDRDRRKAHSHEDAMNIIKEDSGKYFDPVIVQKFIELEPQIIALGKTA